MKGLLTIIGAGIAIVLGISGVSFWYTSFLNFMAVLVPLIILTASGLAIYIGLTDNKDRFKE